MSDDAAPSHAELERQARERAEANAARALATGGERRRAPKMAVREGSEPGAVALAYDHADQEEALALAMAEVGTSDPRLFDGLTLQIAQLGAAGRPLSPHEMDFAMAAIAAAQPRDGFEALLAAQMAAVHVATMDALGKLRRAQTIPWQDAHERAANKLARTFATQMEALRRHRTGGQQKVTVEHVTVHEGGQAIVGHVETGGRGRDGT